MAGGRYRGSYNELSKAMSCLLRHAGQKRGLYFTAGGFVRLWDVVPCLRCHRVSDNVEQDVETVVNTMVHGDGTARFEMTVGPDQHAWIRATRKHTIRGVNVNLPAEILEQDVERAAEYRRRMKESEEAQSSRWQSAGASYGGTTNGYGRTCSQTHSSNPVTTKVGRAKSDFKGSDFWDRENPEKRYLDLLRGEIVIIRSGGGFDGHDKGWYYGTTLTGEEGLFPELFFKPACEGADDLQ